MSDNPQPEENLTEEFRNLGKNLISALQTAWDSPERKRLQDEVVGGLNELGTTLRKEAESLSNSDAGQQLKSNVEQIGERIRSSETQEKVRQELLTALKTANNEIQKVIERWSETNPSAAPESEGTASEESKTE